MVFRIRDVKKYEQCPKKFWLAKQREEEHFPYIYFSSSLTQLAMQYLGIKEEDCFAGIPHQTTQETLDGFASKLWLVEGRFEAHQLRGKISFLKQLSCFEAEAYRMDHPDCPSDDLLADYYVLCRTPHPREEEGKRIAMEAWLLHQCHVRIRNFYLVHLNGEYVREGELDVSQLFCVSSQFFKDENKPGKLVSDVVAKHYHDLLPELEGMQAVLMQEEVVMPYHINCTKHGKCEYYETCFQEELLPDDSILFLSQTRKKYDMFQQGIRSIRELDPDVFALSYLQYAQYQSALTGKVFVDQVALKQWLKQLQGPLSFIDFEWDTIGIPMYDHMKPYDVLVFQFSLHILQDGELKHHEFIATKDARIEFIETLLEHIPITGSVIAYHAEGAEKLRLMELANQFPQYASRLLSICDRMIDLTYPFMNGVVYYPKMRGVFSLKKLLSVIKPDHNYSELPIHHGLQAVASYRGLDSLPQGERAALVEELKAYCSLDTYAMVVVVQELRRLAGLDD